MMKRKSKPLSFLVIFAMLITMMAPGTVFAEAPGVPEGGGSGNPTYTVEPDTTDGAMLMSGPLLDSSQNIILVNADFDDNEVGTDKFKTIQAAITAAEPGTTIQVAPGIYRENVVISKNEIHLIGAGAKNTIIIATGGKEYPLSFSSNNATVEGFTLTHEYSDSELEVWDDTVINNAGVNFRHNTTGNTLQNCIVTLNRNGVYLNDCTGNKIINNVIVNNRTGINMTNNVSGTAIIGNTIANNWTQGLVYYYLSGTPADLSTVTVTNNTFDGNWYSEILIKNASACSGTLDVTNNVFTDDPVTYSTSEHPGLNEPGFDQQKPNVPDIGGTAVKPTTELPTLRIYSSGTVGLKYEKPKTLIVSPEEYQTIQAAIDAVYALPDPASDTEHVIMVADGNYEEDIRIIQDTNKTIILEPEPGGEVTLTGTIAIDGQGRLSGAESLTIKGFIFDFFDFSENTTGGDIIYTLPRGETFGTYNYSHNVYIENCEFIGNPENLRVVAVRFGPSGGHKNVNITDCTGTNLHSLGQFTSVNGVNITRCKVEGGLSGLNLNNSTNISIDKFEFEGSEIGIRAGQSSGTPSDTTLEITDSVIVSSAVCEEANLADPKTALVLRGDAPQNIIINNTTIKNNNPGSYAIANTNGANPTEYTFTLNNADTGSGTFDPTLLGGFAAVKVLGNTLTFHDSIQDAVDAASNDAIIYVAAGEYNEVLTIDKTVELRGAQYGVDARDRNTDAAEESVIACTNPGDYGSVHITADNVIIDGFTFAPVNWPGRINPAGDNIKIRNNIVRQVIYLNDTVSYLTISNNWFKDIATGSAISSDVSDEPFNNLSIVDNKFSNINYSAIILGSKKYRDTVVSGNAIYRTGSQAINLEGDHSDTVVNGNYIEKANMNGDIDKGGIRIYGTNFTGEVTIENNTIVDSFNGFAVKNGENITGKDIIIRNNNFIDNANSGVYNGATAGAIDATGNYWGDAKPAVYGNVNYFPWYVDAEKTRLSNAGYNLNSPSKDKVSVTLSWTGVPGADGYNIYMGTSTTPVNSTPITDTTYTISGLYPSITYSFSLKVIVDGTEYAVSDAALTVTTNASGSPRGDGGGTTQQQTLPSQQTPPAPAALQDPETPDDKKLIEKFESTGNASLDLSGSDNNTAGLSANIVTQLAQENASLTIENEGVQVNFAPNSLITPELQNALNQEGAIVEIGAKPITEEEKQEILANAPLGESTGIFEIGGIIVDLSANVVTGGTSTKIEEFSEPVAVTIDLSDLNLTPEQISQLSGVRYEKDADGNIIPVPLGGTYDPVTKTFTFYTTKFSLYSVVRVPDLVAIEMVIGNNVTKVKGTDTNIDVPPYIINGRTMVPLRFIGEALGAEFVWDGKTRTVTFTLEGKELKLVVDQLLPGMDVPAVIVQGRTMVPVRYVAETFGAEVTWFPTERKVTVVK